MKSKRTGRWLAVGLLAASAFAVSAVVAAGQQSSPPSDPSAAASSSADSMSGSPGDSSMPPASGAPADSSAAAGGVTHVTNGPVPDTPASRANNGAPMSNAGQHTAPAGN